MHMVEHSKDHALVEQGKYVVSYLKQSKWLLSAMNYP